MGWFTPKQPARESDPGNAEYGTLNREQKPRVDAVVEEVRRTGRSAKHAHGGAEYYGYPHAGGGTSWGIDDPVNIKRGVMPRK